MKALSIIVLSLLFGILNAQTNVSGGIFSNTTWTKANSPYLVTDTIVVFPNVTLTIQAGVTVKFVNNVILEIRQAKLIAIGSANDSIIFMSNSPSPSSGMYYGIYLNGGSMGSQFKYCIIRHALKGINATVDSVWIDNSRFDTNLDGVRGTSKMMVDSCLFKFNGGYGLQGLGTATNCYASKCNAGIFSNKVVDCKVDSCQLGIDGAEVYGSTARYNYVGISGGRIDSCISNQNQYGVKVIGTSMVRDCRIDSNSIIGVHIDQTQYDTIDNCKIRYNGIGIYDSSYGGNVFVRNYIENNFYGIRLGTENDSIYCNKFCGNSSYAIWYTAGPNSTSAAGNYWCTPDSATTTPHIFDGYDKISLGIVYFMPIDSTCYLGGFTSVNEYAEQEILIYPNPSSGLFSIDGLETDSNIDVYNIFGENVFSSLPSDDKRAVDISSRSPGIYFLQIQTSNGVVNRKIILSK